ncbi:MULTISPECIES: hypothetical protein [unclassified Streptomyces]|uniref:hypothetical protein n=1 Tax=unclassified Streptomyces TaxID=2593676 RepID=UPI001908C5BB|nr:hypothetical protein [Streptomyces sp. HSG2]
MHLIHVRFQTPNGCRPPENLAALVRAQARPPERVEHVSVHTAEDDSLTLGMFVAADSVLAAEPVAISVALRGLGRVPVLRGSRIADCTTPLSAPYAAIAHDLLDTAGRYMRLPDQDVTES